MSIRQTRFRTVVDGLLKALLKTSMMFAAATQAAAATLTTIANFGGSDALYAPDSPIVQYHGQFYGTSFIFSTKGTSIYKLFPAQKKLAVAATSPGGGNILHASLVELNGMLYGTTADGGTENAGTIYRLNPLTSVLTVLYNFNRNSPIGVTPVSGLTLVGGSLYGATTYGAGESNIRSLFRFNPESNAIVSVYSPTVEEGAYFPTQFVTDGTALYGESEPPSVHNQGLTVFKFDVSTGIQTPIYSYKHQNETETPLAFFENKIFGIRTFGDRKGGYSNIIFELDPVSHKQQVLYSSMTTVAVDFSGPLVFYAGSLYGAVANGIDGVGNGAIFKLDIKNRVLSSVYSFTGGSDGNGPYSGLTRYANDFYGTTDEGGATGHGTIFKLTP